MSNRIIATESPSIEDVLETYEVVPGITSLALGSVHWSPPEEALAKLVPALSVRATHRYGNVLGDDDLRDHLKQLVQRQGIDMTGMDLTVTAGGNQAFVNTVLTLLDDKDHAILLAPFYFAHKLGLQMVGATVDVCPFNKSTLEPEWDKLIEMTQKLRPKMIILTSPNNPSGYVYSEAQVRRVVEICRECDAWLVADQTYHEFLYDDAQHVYPCGSAPVFNYAKIVHLFSFSKLFGMPGWRVGYMVHPEHLTEHMRKVQDMIPTHAAIMSQTLALECLRSHYPLEGPDAYYPKHLPLAKDNYTVWAERTVGSMEPFRRALWPVLQPLGTVYARGAFYFLVPVPDLIDENEALHILSTEFKVMLMTGSAFGAPGHLRVSYGNIKPSEIEACVDKIKRGFAHLLEMSSARKQKAQV